ncbi:hypothetical protein [Shewanella benthica]|uniref:Uncharacterized protein n=1 Tax=Shewanella benthica KT99 TaxID=314608 RepID=A9DJ91_9GAMM|nr:hypothetical protein [Shewanella benthica]EDP98977.1 hypothetical protein KT99_00131 [Shewanella benthica KT99]
MNKLTGTSALSRREKKKEKLASAKFMATPGINPDVEPTKITTVATRRNVTTGTSPVPMRLTENDKAELTLWLDELQSISGKKITTAKLVRGLIHMRSKINDKKLIEAIKDAS